MARIAIVGLAVASLLLLASAASAEEFQHKDVIDLGNDFKELTGDGKIWFVKLYAPWCGHCKRLAPAWGELAEAFAGDADVNIAHVDCTKQHKLCQDLEIRGYPTLKLFHSSLAEPAVHRGARDLSSLKAWVDEQKVQLLETKA